MIVILGTKYNKLETFDVSVNKAHSPSRPESMVQDSS